MTIAKSGYQSVSSILNVSQWLENHRYFNQLDQALHNGNLFAAQQAYSSLSAHTNAPNPNGLLAQIGQALQCEDLNVANQAFASLRQKLRQLRSTHKTKTGWSRAM